VTAVPRQIKRKAAKRPAHRTILVTITEGDYEGWEATARVDFPLTVLEDLESGNVTRLVHALDVILVDHNFPNEHDEIAASMAEVDPYDGLMVVANRVFQAIAKLPNR
jgi:hypothetical protein